MRRPSTVPSNQFGGTAVTVLLVLGLAAAVFFMTMHITATIKRSRVRQSWEATLGTFEDVMRRHPARETNATALEIERIAAALGVDIAPRFLDDQVRPDEATKAAFEAIKKPVFGRYLDTMLERPDAGVFDAPPAEFVDYLARNAAVLRELRAALVPGRTPPFWVSDTAKLTDAPIPNLLGHINLVKLMTAAALERLSAGDEATALEYVDACWQLTIGLTESPIMINQLIAIAQTRMMAGALRHIEHVPDEWLERLEFDFRGAFLEAMKYEGWVWVYMDSYDVSGGGDTWWQKAARPVVEPYATYCFADVSGTWREQIENLERVASICDYDLSAQEADLNIPIPRWNYFGEMLTFNMGGAIERLSRLELDIELTRLTIEAKRAFPSADSARPSSVCSEDAWETTLRDGGLEIAFSRTIGWENQTIGVLLPTHAVLRAPEAGAR